MSNPNPFMFGGGQPTGGDMANPFMDASGGGGGGMGEMNPYMCQPNMMQQGYDCYSGQYNSMPSDPANPFGNYSSMGYGNANMMYNYGGGQAQNPYYDQMAYMTTQTQSVPSNAGTQPAGATAGAALFGVEPEPATSNANSAGAALFGVEPGVTSASMSMASSPPEVNPFLANASETPQSTATPPPVVPSAAPPAPSNAAFNPFADDSSAIEQPAAPIPAAQEAEAIPIVEEQPIVPASIEQGHSRLVSEMVGGLELSTTDMLEKLEIAKTPTVPNVQLEDKSSLPDSEVTSLAGEEVNQILKTDQENVEPEIHSEPSIPIISLDEPEDTKKEDVDEDAAQATTGFSGIFNAELAPDSETIQTATSHIDLSNEDEEESKEDKEPQSDSEKKEDPKSADHSDSDSDDDQPGNEKETLMTGGTAAGLFDDGDSFGGGCEPMPAAMSTGDAIFADIPSMPNIKSTGAAIFGISDESAAGSTGAQLFDIVAPEPSKPCHGEMSGWDENFDKKFDKAEMSARINPDDCFGGSMGMGASAFGAPSHLPLQAEEPAFGDSFGMLPVTADLNNPFLNEGGVPKKSGDGDTPESPLFDSDVSKPLEPFPRVHFEGNCWEMFIRHPPKKKITSQRFWKKVFVRLATQGDTPAVLLFDSKEAKDPFQELPLQAAYSLSDISHQVFDQYSKVFTIKLQYIFYKERAGIRPGQVTKMQKLTDKIGFLAKAVEDADYQGVKEFASDMKKLGVPLEHAPQISELLKLASLSYEDMKQFSVCIEEKLFRIDVHRDRALTYKTEEVQMTAVDEIYVEQDQDGHVLKHLCRVRVFFLSFLSGMPEVDLGVNDMTRIGLEVVGRHDILPVPTEQWIRYEDIEFHSVVDKKAFEAENHIIKFQPPDGCYIEVMRFRTRPPRARELPMQARCTFKIIGNRVEIRAEIMVPYHATKAWGQVPCEDVAMRIPLPECWIYQFRTEKHNLSLSQVRDALSTGNINLGTRMGSVKSAHRRAGKVKGIDRLLGTLETSTQELMETSSGAAKYEHQHRSIVWRVPRLPKHGQGSYTNHEFVCRLVLTSYDQMPDKFDQHFFLEFTQPATCESYTVLRSVSINEGSGEPPEKFVKYLARHEYKIAINFVNEKEMDAYRSATAAPPPPPPPKEDDEEKMREYEDFPEENGKKDDSDSDSD